MGTNAIPTLLEMLRKRDSPFTLRLVALAQKQRLVAFHFDDFSKRALRAINALSTLGPDASNAIPALVELYRQNLLPGNQPTDVDQSRYALQALSASLGFLGPAAKEAVPALLEGMTNKDFSVRTSAIRALGGIHAEPQLALPRLIAALRDSSTLPWMGDGSVQWFAVPAVASYGADAAPAIPALLELLPTTNVSVRCEVLVALGQIHPKTELIMPIMLHYLSDTNVRVAMSAVDAVGSIGPEAKAAVPALVKLLDRPPGHNKEFIKKTLKQIDPQAALEAGIQ